MENKPSPVVPVAILVRVSTKRQETERQVHELRAVAEARGWSVVDVVEEDGVSGAAKDADRHGLARVEALAAAGAIRKVLVHEVSRVGRRPAVVHGFVERLLDLKVSLYWHSNTLIPRCAVGPRCRRSSCWRNTPMWCACCAPGKACAMWRHEPAKAPAQ